LMPEEERVTTYSGLVRALRERIASYVTEGIERARALREAVRLTDEPVEVKGRIWRGSVGAADGGSAILPFADRDVGFISAITVVDDGRSYRRRFRGDLITQREDEGDGEFSDRLDIEREEMMLALAAESVNDASLLIVDGPLIPRPRYSGEYVLQLKRLASEAEKAGTALVGFVKRPQSSFLEELKVTGLTDRAALYMVLEEGQVYPWPPRRWEERGIETLYTYIRLAPPPAAGIFRVDAPVWMGEERLFEVLRHIAATSDPVRSVPAILSKADEEVKMSRRLVRELYREAFELASGRVEPKLWALVTLRWGEE
jgi:hypothetical protein